MNKQLKLDINLSIAQNENQSYLYKWDELQKWQPKISQFHKELVEERKAKKIRFQDLPYQDISHLKALHKEVSGKFDTLVVLGIGGSALGNTALGTALLHSYQQIKNPKGMRLFVTDNVDPDWFSDLFDVIDLDKTLFNVISKSGGTAETMSQFLHVWDLLVKKYGDNAKDHMIATTDPKSGFLLDIANQLGLRKFVVPDGVGGRFSVLTDVGLLSAILVGIDIEELLAGAADMEKRCQTDELLKNPAYLNALIHYLYDAEKGKSISVMMTYSSVLRNLSDWYCQLWGESLGKKYDLNGKEVYTGQTPVKAVGPTDQHSQSQLYCEGPDDKIFTLIEVEKNHRDMTFHNPFKGNGGTDYLDGHGMNELIRAELEGTGIAFADSKRPVVKVIFPEVSAFTVGQFIMMYEIQTAIAGKLYNINPYDQPGVEAAKKATFALMGRAEFAGEKKRIESAYKFDSKFVI